MQPGASPSASQGAHRLGLLYQHILTGVVRLQSGKQKIADIETLRRRMRGALDQAEREASLAGYDAASIREASFAVVALLDETISSSKEPNVNVWQKRPLNIELYGQAVAGDVFFDRLHELERRPDSGQLTDVLEVYLLCLLLGFEGRFAPPLRGEAHRIMERLRLRIEAARNSDYRLSPPIKIDEGTPAPPVRSAYPWYLWAGGALALVVLLFIVYSLNLSGRVSEIERLASGPTGGL